MIPAVSDTILEWNGLVSEAPRHRGATRSRLGLPPTVLTEACPGGRRADKWPPNGTREQAQCPAGVSIYCSKTFGTKEAVCRLPPRHNLLITKQTHQRAPVADSESC